MKLPRQPDCWPTLCTLALTIDQRAQAFQVLRARLLTGQSHQRDLGQSPGMQRLPGLLSIKCGNSGTMVSAQDNDLLMGQSCQYATNVTASDAEQLRQAFFGKATGRMDALFENGVEDARVEIIHL